MTSLDNIDPATLATIAKAIKVSLAGRRPDVGKHEVNETLTLRVSGQVTRAADGERTPTSDIPLKATLALFMRYSGVTGPAALAALERAMREAIEDGEQGASAISEIHEIDSAMDRVKATLAALPKVPKKGAVTVRKGFTVEVA